MQKEMKEKMKQTKESRGKKGSIKKPTLTFT
jgi:hypothetical protein